MAVFVSGNESSDRLLVGVVLPQPAPLPHQTRGVAEDLLAVLGKLNGYHVRVTVRGRRGLVAECDSLVQSPALHLRGLEPVWQPEPADPQCDP